MSTSTTKLSFCTKECNNYSQTILPPINALAYCYYGVGMPTVMKITYKSGF